MIKINELYTFSTNEQVVMNEMLTNSRKLVGINFALMAFHKFLMLTFIYCVCVFLTLYIFIRLLNFQFHI